LTRMRLSGDLAKMQLSVPSVWEFYLPLIEAGIDLTAAEQAWSYRSPLREPAYARARALGDVAGVAELCIAGDGSVYPSVLMVGEARVRCGPLRESPLADIWAHAGELLALDLDDLAGACRSCDLRSLCGGGSRSRALADHGRLDAADSHCPLIG